jgi:hypothetical protein
MTESHDDLGTEVHRLVAAVQDWAKRSIPAPRSETGEAECVSWCPICQFANVLRGEHPEVTERLAEAGAALAAAIKAIADSTLARGHGEAARDDRPRPAPRVQRIRLDEPPDEA